jgi:diguanylate cyclase (GGDEF)-like protein
VESSIKSKLERCLTLPTLPTVAIRVLELCQRENLDLADIAKLVGNDPALAAKVLKTVNSPAFALRQEIRTLGHAVALLGVNAVRTLILSFTLLRDVRREQRAALATYWKRSVLAGLAARELAAEIGYPSREEAFLAALLQDIGVLALRQLGDPIYNDLLESAAYDHERITAGERAAFECDHSEVGAWLVGRWRLPDRFRIAVSYSHRPWRIEPDLSEDLATLIRLTALSGSVADIWVRPDATGAAQRAHIEAAKIFRALNLSLEKVVHKIGAAIPELSNLFEIDLGSADKIAVVLEQAHEALATASVEGVMALRSATPVGIPIVGTGRFKRKDISQERDPVTGLPTRGWAEGYLQEQLRQAGQHGEPMGVMFAQVDRWAELTAELGPADSATLLQSVALCLGSRLRKHDVVAHEADGKFLFILPETTGAGVVVVAERTRKLVHREQQTLGKGRTVSATLSLGCATFEAGAGGTAGELLALAEEALQTAKRAGGDQVTALDPALDAKSGAGGV